MSAYITSSSPVCISFFFLSRGAMHATRAQKLAPSRAFERDGTCPSHLNATRKNVCAVRSSTLRAV